MDRQVFNYRSVGIFIPILGLGIVLWTLLRSLLGSSRSRTSGMGTSAISGLSTAYSVVCVCLAVGVAAFLLLYSFNCRVEIVNGEIVWYDWLGQARIRGPLKTATLITSKSRDSRNKAQVKTEGGVFSLYKSINNYGLLAEQLKAEPEAPHAAGPVQERSYTYRWSQMHLFSFFWLGVIGFMAAMSGNTKKPDGPAPYIFLGVFASIGVWMQLTGWIETIKFGPDGITWIDFLGRTRVKASLDQILRLNETAGSRGQSSFQVDTKQGAVKFSSYLRGCNELVDQVQWAIDSRTGSPAQ